LADGDARAQQPQFQIGPDRGCLSRSAAQGLGRLFGVPGSESDHGRHDDAPIPRQSLDNACGTAQITDTEADTGF